jgi:hypothetical protein
MTITGASTTISNAVNLTGISAASGADILCYNSSGGPVTYATTVVGCVPSAFALKDQVGSLGSVYGEPKWLSIRNPIYKYKPSANLGDKTYVGLYADDVCAMDELLCERNADGTVANYDKIGMLAYTVAHEQSLERRLGRDEIVIFVLVGWSFLMTAMTGALVIRRRNA